MHVGKCGRWEDHNKDCKGLGGDFAKKVGTER